MATTSATPVSRGCKLDVVNEDTPFAESFIDLPFADGDIWNVMRYAGGCVDIAASVVAGMPGFFVKSHRGVKKLIAFSGGTITVEESFDDVAKRTIYKPVGFTITHVPRTLKQAYPGCVKAVSTTPRTAQMTLDPTYGGLILTDSLDRVDFGQDHAVIVQKDATAIAEADWSKDVLPYLLLMQRWQEKGAKVAVTAANGGGVTKKEIYWALEKGIPVIAVRGSGRQTDAFITAFEAGTAKVNYKGDEVPVDKKLVSIVSFEDPDGYRQVLIERGFIVEG